MKHKLYMKEYRDVLLFEGLHTFYMKAQTYN